MVNWKFQYLMASKFGKSGKRKFPIARYKKLFLGKRINFSPVMTRGCFWRGSRWRRDASGCRPGVSGPSGLFATSVEGKKCWKFRIGIIIIKSLDNPLNE